MKTGYALHNCHIIYGDGKKFADTNMTILVNEQGRIHQIEKTSNLVVPSHYESIDLTGNYVMPGLINAHVHLFADGKPFTLSVSEKLLNFAFHHLLDTSIGRRILKKRMKKNAITALHSGVTTMRSVGEFFYKDVELREEIHAHKFVGPNLLTAGYFLSVTGGHGAPYLALVGDSPWEARRNVRINVKHGVDLIKICVTGGVTDAKMVGEAGRLQMTEDEVAAICEEAHKIGIRVAAHVESTEGVRVALKGGVDTIEHGAEMDEEIISLYKCNPRALKGYTALIPTLQAGYPSAKLDLSLTKVSETVQENSRLVYDSMLASVRQAVEHGIKMGIGTDAAMPFVTHYDMWRELDHLMRKTSLDSLQVIEKATKTNAEILGIDHLTGTIEMGKRADLIVMDHNPLENIKTLSNITMVMVNGQLIKNPNVNKMKEVDDLLDLVWSNE
ncbi:MULTISPECIES: amidohydrolase family protein [unclassified Niallia]|uniref:metal-dependent hydrolase family protein n=1 Tax=Niallia TaxID=2837506 RepID=UPI001ED9F79F|nr:MULTISPECIES: amidohydrolase family protein [unclassified Niallia]MCM3030812.1 amidohydrolase family protein [Niallia sp. MER 6]MDL0436145.1 amidohydrolase family protein [Niallia sp. SS-2023]UPO86117.1 amidohydrolase family protein [Niallia sp. Man26]